MRQAVIVGKTVMVTVKCGGLTPTITVTVTITVAVAMGLTVAVRSTWGFCWLAGCWWSTVAVRLAAFVGKSATVTVKYGRLTSHRDRGCGLGAHGCHEMQLWGI